MTIKPSPELVKNFNNAYAVWLTEQQYTAEAAAEAKRQEQISAQCARAQKLAEAAATIDSPRPHERIIVGNTERIYVSPWQAQKASEDIAPEAEPEPAGVLQQAQLERFVEINEPTAAPREIYASTQIWLRLYEPQSGVEAEELAMEFFEPFPQSIFITGIKGPIGPEHERWDDVSNFLNTLEELFQAEA